MVQTRAQERSAQTKAPKEAAKEAPTEMTPVKTTRKGEPPDTETVQPPEKKRRASVAKNKGGTRSDAHAKVEKRPEPEDEPTTQGRQTKSDEKGGPRLKTKIGKLLDKYGGQPLGGMVSQDDLKKWSASEIVMAHILNALFSSTRISHSIAARTLRRVLDEGYQDLEKLHRTTWQERVDVLDDGGYVRYDESTATRLAQLADLVKDKYDDDASNILPQKEKGKKAQATISTRLQEIKGLGPVGIGIFLGSIQGYFPSVAPYLDSRSAKTAQAIGLGDNLDAMYATVGHSPSEMAKLEVALTTTRLEKREKEFTEI